MRIKFIPVILLSLLAVGCNKPNGKTPAQEPECDTYVIDFTQFDLSPYSNLLQSKDSRFNSAILSYIQQKTGDVTTSLTSSGNNHERLSMSDFPGGYTNVQGLIIGSQSSDGEIELSFSKKLYKVSFEIEQYYKIYEGSYYPIEIQYDCQDYNEATEEFFGYSTITANGQRWIGSGVTYHYNIDYTEMYIDLPETNTATFTIGSNQLTISGLASERCRIYSMTLDIIKE